MDLKRGITLCRQWRYADVNVEVLLAVWSSEDQSRLGEGGIVSIVCIQYDAKRLSVEATICTLASH